MAHVAIQVLPLRTSYTVPVAEASIGESIGEAPVVNPLVAIPPDLEGAYGIITGIVFGLLAWVGLLLPALYFLL